MNRRQIIATGVRTVGLVAANATFLRAARAASVSRSILDFGARGDGTTLDTEAIQRAIDIVAQAGGGIVEVPPGNYVTGTLLLKSGVTLKLAQGATLLGSLNPFDYKPVDAFLDAVNVVRGYALLAAIDANNVALTGEGTVDGRGEALQQRGSGPDAKPFLVRWVRCTGVHVSGVTLKNSSAWTMHAFQSSDIEYRDLRIFSYGVENNDGIDIDSSSRVRIDNCMVESQDDSICIKTTSATPCRDVRVTNCTIRTHHGALKIGTESMGDIEGISFSHCHVIDAREGAIKFCSEDGANIRDVTVSDITVDLADTPIFLRLGGRMRTYRKGDPVLPLGSISGITLRNIRVADSTNVGILISGFPGHAVQNIQFEDIYMKLKGEINDPSEGDIVLPEQVKSYPEVWMFGPLIPAYGMYLRHVSGVRMTNVEIKVELPDRRPAILCDDVQDTNLRDIQLTGAAASEWTATIRNSKALILDHIAVAPTTKVFARVRGTESDRIQFRNLKIPQGLRLVQLEDGAMETAIITPAGSSM